MVGGGDRHKIKVINRSVNACVLVNKDQKISLFRTEDTVPSFAPCSTRELLTKVVGSVKHESNFYFFLSLSSVHKFRDVQEECAQDLGTEDPATS